mgnify:FL=1
MKKFLLPATAVFLSFIFSCNFETPEKVSVVTDATYSFTVGEFKKSLSEYMSVEKIQEYVGKSDSSDVKYAVYDYNPPSNNQPNKRPMQKYLVDMTLAEIPVDVGAYLEKMDFSDLNSKGEGISLGQKIAIPNLSEKIETTTINFPDISEKFENETINIVKDLPIWEVDVAPGSAHEIKTTINKPDFKTATLYSGGIVLNVIRTDGTPTPGFSTGFTFELLSEDGKLLSRVDNVDIASGSDIASGGKDIFFDLGTKTITKELKLKIYGNVFGGTPSTVNNYTLNAKFSPGTKFSKITGFTDEIGDSGDVEQYVTISTDETFVECEIASGSLEIVSKKPDGWTGVTAKLSDSRSISGALELPATAKFDSVEDSAAFIRKKMDLAKSVFTKENDPSGKIIFKDRISFSCSNATLVFPNGEQPQVTLETACRIQKASYVVLDLSSKADMLSFSKKIPFSGGMEDYVEEMTLVNSGLEISYKNTLPKGNGGDNEISMEIVSNLLKIDDTGEKKKIMLPQKSETFTSCSPEGQDIPVSPKTDSLDFDVKLILPRDEGMPKNWAVLKNVDLDGEYEISVSAKPVFDWRSVKIKTPEGSEIKGEEDTELSFDKLFSTMKDELGDESEFIDNIKLVELPLYLYFQKPNLASLSGMDFTGNIALKTSTEIPLLDSNEKIKPQNIEIIKTDKDGVVISEFSEENSSGYADIASLFNDSKSENLKIVYDVGLGGLDGTVEISKADYEKLKSENKDAPVSIKISARLVIPLALKLEAPPESDGKVTKVNILKLAKKDSDEDLFDRGEATSLEDIEKYIDLIESATLIYNIDNGLFSYAQSGKSGVILFETNLAGVKRRSYELSMGSGNEKIYTEDVKAMLRTYPFKPDIVASFPDGTLQISRNAEFKVNLAVKIHTNGKITIFGD